MINLDTFTALVILLFISICMLIIVTQIKLRKATILNFLVVMMPFLMLTVLALGTSQISTDCTWAGGIELESEVDLSTLQKDESTGKFRIETETGQIVYVDEVYSSNVTKVLNNAREIKTSVAGYQTYEYKDVLFKGDEQSTSVD